MNDRDRSAKRATSRSPVTRRPIDCSVRLTINGKRQRGARFGRRGRRVRTVVDLRGRRLGRYVVRVVFRTRSGRRVVRTRRYRTCAARRAGV